MFYTNRAVSVKKTKINPGRLQTPILSWHEQRAPTSRAGPAAPPQGTPAWAASVGQLRLPLREVFIDGMLRRAVGFM